MQARLTPQSICDMVSVARDIAAGKLPPKTYFDRWPDISPEEQRDVKELWFQMQYFENDIVYAPDSAEFYRSRIVEFANRIDVWLVTLDGSKPGP